MQSTPTKDLEVTIQLRNNQLKERRVALGLSQHEMAVAIGVSHGRYTALECLRLSPQTRDGQWSSQALRIAMFFEVKPETIWPPDVIDVEKPVLVTKMDAREVRRLAAESRPIQEPDRLLESAETLVMLRAKLAELPAKHRAVLEMRFGLSGRDEMTLAEIGKVYKVSGGRIAQIEGQALRKLRHPKMGLSGE